MASYAFRCADCGDFDATFPIGTAPDRLPCPGCAGPAPRSITAASLTRLAGAYGQVIDQSVASANRPEVVTRIPPGRRPAPQASRNPLPSKLPRP